MRYYIFQKMFNASSYDGYFSFNPYKYCDADTS